MPDPKLALPVRTELRLGKHVVVDRHGRRVAGADAMEDESKATALAASINAAWKDAKATRRAKGAPALTEAFGDGDGGTARPHTRLRQALETLDRVLRAR